MLKIVTLPFDDKMEEFEQEKLEKVLKDVQIVKYQAELVKIEGKYYWTAFVECEKADKFNKNSGKDNFTQDVKEFKVANPNYMEYLTEDEMELYKILKEWRAGEAQLLGYPPYIIASNQLLANIAKTNPKNMEELSQLKGMGKRKIRDYGEEILLILENFYDMKSWMKKIKKMYLYRIEFLWKNSIILIRNPTRRLSNRAKKELCLLLNRAPFYIWYFLEFNF